MNVLCHLRDSPWKVSERDVCRGCIIHPPRATPSTRSQCELQKNLCPGTGVHRTANRLDLCRQRTQSPRRGRQPARRRNAEGWRHPHPRTGTAHRRRSRAQVRQYDRLIPTRRSRRVFDRGPDPLPRGQIRRIRRSAIQTGGHGSRDRRHRSHRAVSAQRQPGHPRIDLPASHDGGPGRTHPGALQPESRFRLLPVLLAGARPARTDPARVDRECPRHRRRDARIRAEPDATCTRPSSKARSSKPTPPPPKWSN